MAQEGRYYSDIRELEVALTAEEANEKLASGYELLKIETVSSMQKLGDLTTEESKKLVFVLGKKKDRNEYHDHDHDHHDRGDRDDRRTDVTIPASIPWTQKNEGFAWAFATNKDGSPIEEYKLLIERLKLSPLERDGYRYSLSKDGKFLQRSKVDSKK
jgi:hypothetical protein